MKARERDTVRWVTSASGDPPLPSPAELAALESQVNECVRARGRIFSIRCRLEALNRIFASRIVMAVVVAILFLCAASLVYLS